MTSLQVEDIIFINKTVIDLIHYVCSHNIKAKKNFVEYFYSDDVNEIILQDVEAYLVNLQDFLVDCAEQTNDYSALCRINQTAVDIYIKLNQKNTQSLAGYMNGSKIFYYNN